jgi:hypothetical protein
LLRAFGYARTACRRTATLLLAVESEVWRTRGGANENVFRENDPTSAELDDAAACSLGGVSLVTRRDSACRDC